MAHDAADVAPGADGLLCLPYFAGSVLRSTIPGARRLLWLTGRHTRAHMVRAALEGVAYTVASHVDIIEREHGLPIGRIMLVGGGTKNPVWMQAIADVCGREVSVAKVTVGACFGDAIMAALAGGAMHHGMSLPKSLALHKQSCPIWLPTSYASRRHIFDELYARNRDLMRIGVMPPSCTAFQ
ncbi:MAG: FGGY-family carbohydrate kinase [Collinsella aerofaciens]